jgi:predicted short-subunit dehydrogenase-like oxidoreductase (DUF2520 family)
MRQVPDAAAPIGVVGSGRVARHLLHYFSLLGLPVRAWSRQASAASPIETLADCRTVLVLVRDDQIVPFIEAWPSLRAKRLVHCSGSLVTPAAEGAHPLMTFGHSLYALDVYRRMAFIVDQGGTPFPDLLPGLPNPWFTVRAADRAYYHAVCVLAGNGSTLLWQKLFDAFEQRFGIPASAAHPFLERVAANLAGDASGALTGPLSRGDSGTIAANLAALADDPFAAVYRALVRTYEQRS